MTIRYRRVSMLIVLAVLVSIADNRASAQSPLQENNLREYQRLLGTPPAARQRGLQAPKPSSVIGPRTFAAPAPSLRPCIGAAASQYEQVKAGVRLLPCAPGASDIEHFIVWHQIALDTTAVDHTPPQPDQGGPNYLQQPGPHRASYAMAIVHIAMFDAINETTRPHRRYRSYSEFPDPVTGTPAPSVALALGYAAHASLKALYTDQAEEIDDFLKQYLGVIRSDQNAPLSPEEEAGMALGKLAAAKILMRRNSDRSRHMEPNVGDPGFSENTVPGKWRPDPISQLRVALGGRWSEVTPFSIPRADSFRAPPPPPLSDEAYAVAYNEVKRLGSDGVRTPTTRRDFETFKGIFWAYDGTPALCAPPRLYNQIVRTVVFDRATVNGVDPKDLMVQDVARLFALVNVAMADAAISAWEAKWHYQFWRPITGIRSGALDVNQRTDPDSIWTPLGAPNSNTRNPNFTPPFPAYPSGHAVFGGAVFGILRQFWPDNTAFVFTSDEFNGRNKGKFDESPRPDLPQAFVSFSHPEYENARSRVYLGVHWQFDADAGIAQGNEVAYHVFNDRFRCVNERNEIVPCGSILGATIALP